MCVLAFPQYELNRAQTIFVFFFFQFRKSCASQADILYLYSCHLFLTWHRYAIVVVVIIIKSSSFSSILLRISFLFMFSLCVFRIQSARFTWFLGVESVVCRDCNRTVFLLRIVSSTFVACVLKQKIWLLWSNTKNKFNEMENDFDENRKYWKSRQMWDHMLYTYVRQQRCFYTQFIVFKNFVFFVLIRIIEFQRVNTSIRIYHRIILTPGIIYSIQRFSLITSLVSTSIHSF